MNQITLLLPHSKILVHIHSFLTNKMNILFIAYKTNVHVATLDKVVEKRIIEKCKMEIIFVGI